MKQEFRRKKEHTWLRDKRKASWQYNFELGLQNEQDSGVKMGIGS